MMAARSELEALCPENGHSLIPLGQTSLRDSTFPELCLASTPLAQQAGDQGAQA